MKAALQYTAARFALFAAVFGILYLVGARGVLLVALALLLSGLVSYVLLSRQRDAFSTVVNDRVRKLNQRVAAGATSEDPPDETR